MLYSKPAALLQLPYANGEEMSYAKERTHHKGKILIVDDDINVVNAMQAYLTECGYIAVGCSPGKDAIELLKTSDFELMLIDLMMPEMNGIQLLKHALEIDPHLMGIILTGKGSLETATEMMKEGAFLCFLKPFNFRMMQIILSCAIKARRIRKLEEKYLLLHEEASRSVWEQQNFDDRRDRPAQARSGAPTCTASAMGRRTPWRGHPCSARAIFHRTSRFGRLRLVD